MAGEHRHGSAVIGHVDVQMIQSPSAEFARRRMASQAYATWINRDLRPGGAKR